MVRLKFESFLLQSPSLLDPPPRLDTVAMVCDQGVDIAVRHFADLPHTIDQRHFAKLFKPAVRQGHAKRALRQKPLYPGPLVLDGLGHPTEILS